MTLALVDRRTHKSQAHIIVKKGPCLHVDESVRHTFTKALRREDVFRKSFWVAALRGRCHGVVAPAPSSTHSKSKSCTGCPLVSLPRDHMLPTRASLLLTLPLVCGGLVYHPAS